MARGAIQLARIPIPIPTTTAAVIPLILSSKFPHPVLPPYPLAVVVVVVLVLVVVAYNHLGSRGNTARTHGVVSLPANRPANRDPARNNSSSQVTSSSSAAAPAPPHQLCPLACSARLTKLTALCLAATEPAGAATSFLFPSRGGSVLGSISSRGRRHRRLPRTLLCSALHRPSSFFFCFLYLQFSTRPAASSYTSSHRAFLCSTPHRLGLPATMNSCSGGLAADDGLCCAGGAQAARPSSCILIATATAAACSLTKQL